jgi:hypothetical protein
MKRFPFFNLNLQSILYLLLIISLTVLFGFQMATAVLASSSGTDFIKNAISLFVYMPYGWTQIVSFYLLGFSLLAVAVIFHYKTQPKLGTSSILLAIMALAFFFIGTFPTRLPGAPHTLVSDIHLGASIVIIMAFPLVCFFMVPILKTRKLRFLYIYTIIAGIFQVLFIFIGGYFISHLTGLYERLLISNGQMWIIVVCLNLLFAGLKEQLPLRMTKYFITRFSILGFLYVYGALLWPLCLPLIGLFPFNH